MDSMAAWFWNGVFFKRIPINEEQIIQDSVYTDGEKRNWESWKNVELL
jgi:hypothetical protein